MEEASTLSLCTIEYQHNVRDFPEYILTMVMYVATAVVQVVTVMSSAAVGNGIVHVLLSCLNFESRNICFRQRHLHVVRSCGKPKHFDFVQRY